MSKVRILVVADDITGAAEVAGVAHEAGCRVRFTTSWEGLAEAEESEVTVLATDTRSMPQSQARQCAQAVVDTLRQGENPYTHLFKKTDSVLRGWVADELAPFAELGYDKVLLMPANPSKGRTIEQGEYRINGTPLHETVFSTDPEFPARTSSVEALVGGGSRCITPQTTTLERGISIGEAATTANYDLYMAHFGDGKTLLAGAADHFQALLRHLGFGGQGTKPFAGYGNRRTLIVLGSTVRHDLTKEPFFARNQVAVSPMPDAVFAGGEAEAWISNSLAMAREGDSLLLRIPQAVAVDGNRARHLRRVMSETVEELIHTLQPEEVVIEGGATAFALIERLGWRELGVSNQIAPGVVRLHYPPKGVYLTFKPGSYPWGDCFK